MEIILNPGTLTGLTLAADTVVDLSCLKLGLGVKG